MTGTPSLTPMLMVIVMLHRRSARYVPDTDHCAPRRCQQLENRLIDDAGGLMGISELFLHRRSGDSQIPLGFGIETLQTVAFLAIVSGNQATTYRIVSANVWVCRPGRWLVAFP